MYYYKVFWAFSHAYVGSYICLIGVLYTLVAAKVAEKKFHKIVGYSVEVVLFTGAIEDVTSDDPTSVVSDNVLILDNVPSSMSDDVLMLYIDSITELDGEQNDYSIDHDNAEVIITFNATLDTLKFPAGMYNICSYL